MKLPFTTIVASFIVAVSHCQSQSPISTSKPVNPPRAYVEEEKPEHRPRPQVFVAKTTSPTSLIPPTQLPEVVVAVVKPSNPKREMPHPGRVRGATERPIFPPTLAPTFPPTLAPTACASAAVKCLEITGVLCNTVTCRCGALFSSETFEVYNPNCFAVTIPLSPTVVVSPHGSAEIFVGATYLYINCGTSRTFSLPATPISSINGASICTTTFTVSS